MPASPDQTALESWNARTDPFVSSAAYLAPKQESRRHTSTPEQEPLGVLLPQNKFLFASWAVLQQGLGHCNVFQATADLPSAIGARGRQQEP